MPLLSVSISFISYGLPFHNTLSSRDARSTTIPKAQAKYSASKRSCSNLLIPALHSCSGLTECMHPRLSFIFLSPLYLAPVSFAHPLHLLWPPFPYTLTLVQRLFSRHRRSTQYSKFKRSLSSFAQSLRFDLKRAYRIINSFPLFLVTPAASRPPYFIADDSYLVWLPSAITPFHSTSSSAQRQSHSRVKYSLQGVLSVALKSLGTPLSKSLSVRSSCP